MEIVKLIKQLIQIPSPSGKEGAIAEFIMSYCGKFGIPAELREGNVIAHLQGTNRQKALIFNSHMDTVAVANPHLWRHPPFGENAGKSIGGKVYGLGASDDKGAIAAMLVLAQYFSTCRQKIISPPIDLWFTFVTKEETDGSGMATFLDWFVRSKYFKTYKNIAAVIGEPTNLASIEIGHRGNAFIKVEATGTGGHGAKMHDERELATTKILEAIAKLKKEFTSVKKKYKDPILGEPSMNITGIQTSKSSLNTIPQSCRAVFDIRTTPALHERLLKVLHDILGDFVTITEEEKSKPPGITSQDSKITQCFKSLLPNIAVLVSMGSTDLAQFRQAGIDAVVFGPGKKTAIHKENEFIEVSKISKCVTLYKKIIDTY